jgi:hypothetical protein
MNRILQASFLILLFFSSSILLSQEDEQQDFSNERKLSAGMTFGNGFENSQEGLNFVRGYSWEVSYRFRVFNIKGPFHVSGAFMNFSTGHPIEIDQKEYEFSSSVLTLPLRLRWGPEVEGSIEPFLQGGAYYAMASEDDLDIYISENGMLQERIMVDDFESFGHVFGLGLRYYNPDHRISVVTSFEKFVDYKDAVPEYSIGFSRYMFTASFRYNIL